MRENRARFFIVNLALVYLAQIVDISVAFPANDLNTDNNNNKTAADSSSLTTSTTTVSPTEIPRDDKQMEVTDFRFIDDDASTVFLDYVNDKTSVENFTKPQNPIGVATYSLSLKEFNDCPKGQTSAFDGTCRDVDY